MNQPFFGCRVQALLGGVLRNPGARKRLNNRSLSQAIVTCGHGMHGMKSSRLEESTLRDWCVREEVRIETGFEHAVAARLRNLCRSHIDLLPARIPALHLLLPDQSATLCVDAVVCAPSGNPVLCSGKCSGGSKLAAARGLGETRAQISYRRGTAACRRRLPQPASIPARPRRQSNGPQLEPGKLASPDCLYAVAPSRRQTCRTEWS